MNIATRFWGWALLVVGLGLAILAWAPAAQADHPKPGGPDPVDDSLLTQEHCEASNNFEHLTGRQQAICGAGGINPDPGGSIAKLVEKIVSILSWVAGVAAIIVVLVQGLRMTLSGGDSSAITSARNGIIYAIVGLVIAVAAPHLVGFGLSVVVT